MSERKNAEDRSRRYRQQGDKSKQPRAYPAADSGGGVATAGKKGDGKSSSQPPKKSGKGKGKKKKTDSDGGQNSKDGRGSMTPRGASPGKGKGKGAGKSKGKEREDEQALRAKEDENKKSPCMFHYTAEGCRAGDSCSFSHTIQLTDAEKKVAQRMAKSIIERARSRSSSRGRAPRSEQPCYAFKQTGHCSFGKACRYKHE